jgi:aminoglycoside phosphotransferase
MTAHLVDIQPQHVRTLTGHSGCSVSLCLQGDRYFVRKVSASPAYNQRFQLQIEKQNALAAVIETPRVLQQGEAGDLLWYDMEYIRGHGFVSFAPLQAVSSIPSIVERVTDPLQRMATTANGCLDPALFHAKIADLKTSIAKSPFYETEAEFLDALLDRLAAQPWCGIPRTMCHGDLTVENMLIRDDGSIVFIDLLDGNLESVWMDVAKLIQDLESGWSLRNILWHEHPDPTAKLLRTISHYLSEEITSQMTSVYPDLGAALPSLRAIQALRVLPYVHDATVFSRVVTGLRRIGTIEAYA